MCGHPEWRKGTDLFVQLAVHVRRLVGPAKCHLLWLGGPPNSHLEALYDIAQLGLQNTCHFVPTVPNPESYYSAMDLFALTSREDPFSVAMLEAALSGLPIVCFAGAGGAPELVERDAGIVVPYLDVSAMAEACVELFVDDKRRQRLGETAHAKVQERYTLAKQGPKLLAVLEAAMQKDKSWEANGTRNNCKLKGPTPHVLFG
jgi:glycosyltransferase involved in cell wall biosynthesis